MVGPEPSTVPGRTLAVPFVEIGLARLDQRCVEDVGPLMQIAHGFDVAAAADVVAADDELAEVRRDRRRANIGVAVTRLVVSVSLRLSAEMPSTAVEETPPRAPINQRPTRR